MKWGEFENEGNLSSGPGQFPHYVIQRGELTVALAAVNATLVRR